MSGVEHITISKDEDGKRLDRWLGDRGVPFFLVHKFCRSGQLRIDGKRAKAANRLKEGQVVRMPPFTPRETDGTNKKQRPLSDDDRAYIHSLVIYDDGQVIALNKPSGLATQGGSNIKKHVDRLIEGLADKDGVKPRLVHRLDKDTSGLLLLARSASVARALGNIFKSRDIDKYYLGLVMPAPELAEGEIKAPVLKMSSGRDKERMHVNEEGKFAHTIYRQLDHAARKAALIAYKPLTGRTHQIRVHSAYMGCPLIGDFKYGFESESTANLGLKKRLHLHAYRLSLPYPGNEKKRLDLTAPLPDDFRTNMNALGFDGRIDDQLLDF